ncbi:uncharacterized protein LOC106643211 [Copidosoma floridanum]|uniref:uncharacterized protein LOC106643211 n=1 Tax=Copidosoma floridanum TaxID=29053 RepID=UPI0006C9D614|nr:uncharacterized protein LOC106643211 [Copidosoma floridanum]
MPFNLVSRLADRMGNTSITRQRRASRRASSEGNENGPREDGDPEREELWAMKRLIKERPGAFILDNLVLSVQLFSNYEREMEEARRKLVAKEQKINQKLLPMKSVLMPDVLREHFADRVRFTARPGKSDNDDVTVEPIRPIRLYMIYENVLVAEVDETQHYYNPTELAIEYNFVLREANHKGYARLEQRKTTAPKENGLDVNDVSSIVENESEAYSDDGSVYGPISKRRVPLARSTSTSMPDLFDEDNYYEEDNARVTSNGQSTPRSSQRPANSGSSSSSGYTTTAYGPDSDSDSSTPSSAYPRVTSRGGRKTNSWLLGCDIPAECLKTVIFTYDGRIYNPKREPKALTRQQRRIRDAKIAKNKDIVYVNGYKLAKYFYEGFKAQAGRLLGFDEPSVRNAKRCDATIRLETIEHLSPKDQSAYVKIEAYEVVPCFASPWPRWARGWLDRERAEWPSDEQLRRAEKCGCFLVPETSRLHGPATDEPNHHHPLWKLDWSLNYPAAERYLETCLSASQATVYAVCLVLHKTFLRALGPSFGLDTGHVRNMVFLMAEKNPDWSVLHMGQWTLNLLESLHGCIQQRAMSDYFMHERNLFASVNADDLLHAQKQLKRIIDNPVLFVLHALEGIQYERVDAEVCRGGGCLCCYPRLDHARLLKLLLTRHELVLRNSNLQVSHEEAHGSSSALGYYYARRDPVGKDFWTEAKQNSQQYIMQASSRRRTDRIAVLPKREHDSVIDIQEKCEPLTPIRLSMILEFFAEHFLRVARCCHERGATRSKRAYLDQVKLLGSLLAEDQDYQDTARSLLQQARELYDRTRPPDVPPRPEIPKRNNADSRTSRQVSYEGCNGESADNHTDGAARGSSEAPETLLGRNSDWPIFLQSPGVPGEPKALLRSLRSLADRPIFTKRQVVACEEEEDEFPADVDKRGTSGAEGDEGEPKGVANSEITR